MLAKPADMTGGSASPIRRMRTPVRSRAVIDCPDNDPRLSAQRPAALYDDEPPARDPR